MTPNQKRSPFFSQTSFIFLLVLFFLSGCASIEHRYSLNYKKLSLSHTQLTHEGLAVLPMSFRYEEELYVKTAQAIFLKNLRGLKKDVDLVEPAEEVKL